MEAISFQPRRVVKWLSRKTDTFVFWVRVPACLLKLLFMTLVERFKYQLDNYSEPYPYWFTKHYHSGKPIKKGEIMLHAFLRIKNELEVVDIELSECDVLYELSPEDENKSGVPIIIKK